MRTLLFFACLIICSLRADEGQELSLADEPGGEIEAPWFTGPLISPSSTAVPLGHFNLETYFYATANTASYNDHWKADEMNTLWNISFLPQWQIGLTPWMDIQLNPVFFYSFTEGAASWGFSDLQAQFDFQLYKTKNKVTEWNSSLKLAVIEIFPCGKYQNLNPKKLSTDIGGAGSWKSALGLVWGNLFYFGKEHFLSTRCSVQYGYSLPVHVKNLNAYGGGSGTKGTVYPGQTFQFDLAGEYSFTKNWVFAMDIFGTWSAKSRFSGTSAVKNTLNSSFQLSLAPAIEYNWNSQLGIIFGPWFTVAGLNAYQFATGIFALNYYY